LALSAPSRAPPTWFWAGHGRLDPDDLALGGLSDDERAAFLAAFAE